MNRRELVLVLGGTVVAAHALHAQQKAPPMIGFLSGGSPAPFAPIVAAFHHGLSEIGYVEGQNVTIEYRWAEGHYDRLPPLAADFVARNVDMIAADGIPAALAAKARPRRSQSSLASATRSISAWSPISPGRAATSQASAPWHPS